MSWRLDIKLDEMQKDEKMTVIFQIEHDWDLSDVFAWMLT